MARLNDRWWLEAPHWAPRVRTEGYLARIGLLKREQRNLSGDAAYTQRGHWAEVLVLQVYFATASLPSYSWIRTCHAFGRLVKLNPDLGEAMVSAFRLGGRHAARLYIQQLLRPPAPKPTPEEAKAIRASRTQALLQRRYEEAEAKLAEHERLLKMEQRLVRKWRRKVRRYERK